MEPTYAVYWSEADGPRYVGRIGVAGTFVELAGTTAGGGRSLARILFGELSGSRYERGRLYLELVSRTFTVFVRSELSLNQLRLQVGKSRRDDTEVVALHAEDPILFSGAEAVPPGELVLADGLFLSVDLVGKEDGQVGFRAKKNSQLLDLTKRDHYDPEDFWEPVHRERGNRLVLEPEEFYLLISKERVRIPPGYSAEMTAYDPTSGELRTHYAGFFEPIYAAEGRIILQPEEFYLLISRERVEIPPSLGAEMTAYDPTAGELRTHYAGFFDPGFGHTPGLAKQGSKAVMEVRAHDVPFMLQHGQRVAKLVFEELAEEPSILYGQDIGSSYQHQERMLSKHFRA